MFSQTRTPGISSKILHVNRLKIKILPNIKHHKYSKFKFLKFKIRVGHSIKLTSDLFSASRLQGNSGLLGKIWPGEANLGDLKMLRAWWSILCSSGLMNTSWRIKIPSTSAVDTTCKSLLIAMSTINWVMKFPSVCLDMTSDTSLRWHMTVQLTLVARSLATVTATRPDSSLAIMRLATLKATEFTSVAGRRLVVSSARIRTIQLSVMLTSRLIPIKSTKTHL